MNTSELNRKLNNLISIGTVTESKSSEGLSLARVKILQRVTDFFPVLGTANSFKSHATPIKVGEQVLVFCPYGEADSGIILGSIFNKGQKEPAGYRSSKEVTQYSDGTVISYDVGSKMLEIDAVGVIDISALSMILNANVTINGNVSINGNLDSTGSISDSKGSLTGHVHTGIFPGTANTGTRP